MGIIKAHRNVSFEQKSWLRPYISRTIKKMKTTKNEFSKEFCKLFFIALFRETTKNQETDIISSP